MIKKIEIVLGIILCLCLSACGEQKVSQTSSQINIAENQSANSQTTELPSINIETPDAGEKKLKLTINEQEIDVTLYDTPVANALYDRLPLKLNFEDFNGIEKIAYMDNELPIEGEPDEFDPDVGDLCLYAPWGNLSIFYKDFGNSNGLISLGHIDSGMDLIAAMNSDFSATLDKAA